MLYQLLRFMPSWADLATRLTAERLAEACNGQAAGLFLIVMKQAGSLRI